MRLTLNDSQQNDDDKEEEGDVKHDSVDFIVVSIWGFDLVSNTSSGSHSLVQVEHETLQQSWIML